MLNLTSRTAVIIVAGGIATILCLLTIFRDVIDVSFVRSSVAPTRIQDAVEPVDCSPPPLTFITLLFGRPSYLDHIEHNCKLIKSSPGNHNFIIFSERLDFKFCKLCECRPFVKWNYTCDHTCVDVFAEKARFITEVTKKIHEFVFLDTDLVIMKPEFITQLQPRTTTHDLVISYDQLFLQEKSYYKILNTGLFFMRYLPHVNYSELMTDFYEMDRKGRLTDQPPFSIFAFRNYKNWDTLSLRFHCRWVTEEFGIPLDECLTIHDKTNGPRLRRSLNFTFLKI